MINYNPRLTVAEAKALYAAPNARYPATEHNRKMMAQIVRAHISYLQHQTLNL